MIVPPAPPPPPASNPPPVVFSPSFPLEIIFPVPETVP